MLVIRGRRVCANQFRKTREKKKKSANRATLVSFKHPTATRLMLWVYGHKLVICLLFEENLVHSFSLSYANIHHIYIFICSIFLLKWERWGTGNGGVQLEMKICFIEGVQFGRK